MLLGLALDHGMKLLAAATPRGCVRQPRPTHGSAEPAGAGPQATRDAGPVGSAGTSVQGRRHPGDQPPETGSRTVRFEPHRPVAVPSRNRSTAALDD